MHCCGLCCFGWLTLCGCRDRIANRAIFQAPNPPSYKLYIASQDRYYDTRPPFMSPPITYDSKIPIQLAVQSYYHPEQYDVRLNRLTVSNAKAQIVVEEKFVI